MEIILASGSPRRRELLGLCCPDFRVEVSGADEHVTEALSPEQLVARLAEKKASEVASRFPEAAVEAYHIGNVIHAVHPNAITRHHEHLTKVAVTEKPSLLEVPLPLGKLLFESSHEELEQIQAFLRQQGWAEDYEVIFSGRNLLEMTAKGADKGGMVRRLARRLEIRPESLNPYGMVHGGALYTMADDAAGSAAHSDGRYYVTQSGELHFLRNQPNGVLRAVGVVRHRGKSTVLVQVDITNEDGTLLATGEFSLFCVNKSTMDQKAPAQ